MLKPILPRTVEAAEAFLGAPIASFDDARRTVFGLAVQPFEPLLVAHRPASSIDAMVEASKDSLAPSDDAPKPRKQADDRDQD